MLLNILQSIGDHTTKNYLVQNIHAVRWGNPTLAHQFDPAFRTWEAVSTRREKELQYWAGALPPLLSQGPQGRGAQHGLGEGPPPQSTVGGLLVWLGLPLLGFVTHPGLECQPFFDPQHSLFHCQLNEPSLMFSLRIMGRLADLLVLWARQETGAEGGSWRSLGVLLC